MIKSLGCLAGLVLLTAEASAMTAMTPSKLASQDALPIEQVKIVCNENGQCFKPPTRKLVARWVYGDRNFEGPYAGPGYYGNPAYRYRWWPFW